MFYRHRDAVDEEPLSALVHQTAMYHEDRLGGSRVRARVALRRRPGAGPRTLRGENRASGSACRPRPSTCGRAAALRSRIGASTDVLDALAAPVGVLLRDRRAA